MPIRSRIGNKEYNNYYSSYESKKRMGWSPKELKEWKMDNIGREIASKQVELKRLENTIPRDERAIEAKKKEIIILQVEQKNQ